MLRAADTMFEHSDARNPRVGGIMSGIKRRARARAIVAFARQFAPPPPDYSITTMRNILGDLFIRSISNNDLQRYFATPGRRADNRVDLARNELWLEAHRSRFEHEALQLISDLDAEWELFKADAAQLAGKYRREERERARTQNPDTV
jgi:hypothetical protein